MNQVFDVVIIGGGPSGSCAAIRLLDLGYTVGLIEKDPFPRANIGESLSPGAHNIFSYLGAKDLLNREEYLHDLSARVIWESEQPDFISAAQRGPGVVVDRGIMDKDLLYFAVQKGLVLFQPARVKKMNENTISFMVDEKDYTVEAKQFINAGGRAGVLAKHRLSTGPSSIALWVHVKNAQKKETLVEAQQKGWLWGSPLPDKSYRIMFYCDPETVKGESLENIMDKQLKESLLFSEFRQKIIDRKVRTCPVMPFVNKEPWKDNLISVGDAAFTMDPLSSTGVEKAMRLSLQAAIAVNTALKTSSGGIAKNFYFERIVESVTSHAQWTADYYSKSWLSQDNEFWRRRASVCELQKGSSEIGNMILQNINAESSTVYLEKEISISQTAKFLWDKKLSLTDECSFQKTACVQDDLVKMNYALSHPSLKRSVAFLGQTYLYPLLERIDGGKSFGELVNAWSVFCPHKQSVSILTWLWSKKIISTN